MNASKPEDQLSAVLSSFWEEILPKVEAYAIPIILGRIQEWVGDQLEMTEVLCTYAVRYAAQLKEEDAGVVVDLIVQEEITESWQKSLAASHLHKIETTLLDYGRRDSLLILYIQILQRGKVPLKNSPEQAVLLRSGLAKANRGNLEVANSLYAKVFDLDWAERQLPGITKPIAIVSTAAADSQFDWRAKLSPQVAIAACGLAGLVAAIFFYTKETDTQAIATPNSLRNPGAALTTSEATIRPSSRAFDRKFFDDGTEHAKNSRWISMMRDFCSIPVDSTYFAPAQKRLEQWAELYQEDILTARDIVMKEEKRSCDVVQNVD
ncbi:MAG: hypothetical protein WBA76_20120 [Phormidesmis sp.]